MMLNIHEPRPLAPNEKPFRATHLTEQETLALFDRLAKYKRRRQAAERGEDWQKAT